MTEGKLADILIKNTLQSLNLLQEVTVILSCIYVQILEGIYFDQFIVLMWWNSCLGSVFEQIIWRPHLLKA